MPFKKIMVTLLGAVVISLTACGGGDSGTGGGESLAQQRETTECITISGRTVTNSCNFSVVVRIFAGTEAPFTIDANSVFTVTDSGVTGIIRFGACEARFPPVRRDDGFECL